MGSFENETLQNLYDSLTSLGSTDLESAFMVGALIEEVDINDLNLAIESLDNEGVIVVYQNLNKGSRNHLRSFYMKITSTGIDYKPQILEENYFNAIVNSDMETGAVGN